MNESTVSNPPMPAYLGNFFKMMKERRINTVETPLTVGGMNESTVSNPPMPAYLDNWFKMMKERRPNTVETPLTVGGKRRKNTRKYKNRKITRKIYRGGQALPKPTLSFLRSYVDPNAVNKVFNNTAIIRISYPTQIVDSLYKLEARLLNPNGVNIASTKIKNIDNIRELTVSELQVSIRYQLTVKLVNKTTNNKSVDSNTLTIVITPPPAPRPAPRPSPRPAPRPAPAPPAIPGTITTVAGNGMVGFSGDGGPAMSARFDCPVQTAVERNGNLLISDWGNHRIRRLDVRTGIITTVAGNGAISESFYGTFSGDGGPATSAGLNCPGGIAIDNNGNIFIAETYNHRIRRVDARTGIITTVAGNGTIHLGGGDGGPATEALLHRPEGVEVDGGGNIFIAELGQNRIRRVDARTGIITTVAGAGGNGGVPLRGDFSDLGGPAMNARLCFPISVALDRNGNLFIADCGNGRILRVNANTGIITNIAGNGDTEFSGDGKAATRAGIYGPGGLAVDANGNVYFADKAAHRIRRVSAHTGIITTVVGSGPSTTGLSGNFSGDGGPATRARLNYPNEPTFDASGNMYITDIANQRIRKVNGPFV
jgi:sugar lactone lactonase YvrE